MIPSAELPAFIMVIKMILRSDSVISSFIPRIVAVVPFVNKDTTITSGSHHTRRKRLSGMLHAKKSRRHLPGWRKGRGQDPESVGDDELLHIIRSS